MDINHLCPQCMKELKEGRKNACPHCGFVFSDAQQVMHQLKPFTVLAGKYLVGNVLGEGGFGITYVGFDTVLQIRVAIKEFYPNGFVSREANFSNELTAYTGQSTELVSKWRDNFLKEARSLAKCAHLAGVVGVKEYFLENNTAYIVQEYLDGITLKEYVKTHGGRISADWLLPAMEPVMFALGEVHKEGLIHRDISPDNIMMLHSGQMKLLDFGAARDYADTKGKSLSVVLKPGYAPPEQYTSKGRQGPWTDIYALAATMYRCLTGITPPEAMDRLTAEELQKPSQLGIWLPASVEEALWKALSVRAEGRYQTMEAFHRALYGGTAVTQAYVIPEPTVQQMPFGYGAAVNSGVPAGYGAVDSNVSKSPAEGSQPSEEDGKDKTVLTVAAVSSAAALIVAVAAAVFLMISISGKKGGEDTTQTAGNHTEASQSEQKTAESEQTQKENIEDLSDGQEQQPSAAAEDGGQKTEKGQQVEEDSETEAESEPKADPSQQELTEQFGIVSGTPEDYAANLDPGNYLYYDSVISDFNFYYPSSLYNTVDVDTEDTEGRFGSNVQRVYFSGEDGGSLAFSIFRRTDGMSLEEMADLVYAVELPSLKDASLIRQNVEEDYARVIVTGYTSGLGMPVYDMVKIEPEYILQMFMIFPEYTTDEDEMQKGYVTECVYRLCGFSGSSSAPRSFEEYQAYWEENLR